jgi:UDP-2-acetamido-3-amino-2,3-dideoxy-glucuronate N-acetyltransferase
MRDLPGGARAHESSYVDEGAIVGAGTIIWHFCHVMSGAVIGERCSLGQNVVVMPRVTLGCNVKVQNNVSLYEGVRCEDDVFLGPSMVFTNVINPRSHVSRKHEYRETLVRRGASIGANATVVCGNTLGEFAFVGAGAVVTREVPAYALVVGVPARVSGWVCQCGERLPLPARVAVRTMVQCAACGERYEAEGQIVRRADA